MHRNSERVGFIYTLFNIIGDGLFRQKHKNTTKMSTELALVAAKALPALSGSSLTYNPEKNVYLTLGYTSAAGNTYYRAIRFSKRLAVYYHIGEGYAHTFLNGITLFCWDGRKQRSSPRSSGEVATGDASLSSSLRNKASSC